MSHAPLQQEMPISIPHQTNQTGSTASSRFLVPAPAMLEVQGSPANGSAIAACGRAANPGANVSSGEFAKTYRVRAAFIQSVTTAESITGFWTSCHCGLAIVTKPPVTELPCLPRVQGTAHKNGRGNHSCLPRETRVNQAVATGLFAGFNGGLSGCKAGDWDSPRAAAHVVQADFVAEVDGLGIAAVFATDADLQVRSS